MKYISRTKIKTGALACAQREVSVTVDNDLYSAHAVLGACNTATAFPLRRLKPSKLTHTLSYQ